MNKRQLEYALTVAEERSFTEAAKKLIIAQPSLSQYINKLEQELGHKLFDRSVTPIRLTAAGELYIKTAHKILDLDKQMWQQLSDMDNEPHGKLLIGASPHHSLYTLPMVIKQFTEQYPYYDIIICEQTNDLRMKLLEKGELDLCLAMLPVSESKFSWVEVMMEGLLLAVPFENPLNDRLTILGSVKPGNQYPMVDLRELKDIPFLMVSENHNLYKVTNELCHQAGFQPRKAVECESTQVCHMLVSAGVGIAILQSGCANYGGLSQKIQYYSILQNYPVRCLAAIYRKNQYISRAIKDFIEMLKLNSIGFKL